MELMEDILLNTNLKNEEKTEDVINEYIKDERIKFADETFNLMTTYGFKVQNDYLVKLIDTFVKEYKKEQIIVFVLNVALMILNQIASIWIMKHIIEEVDIELKNIFALMPFPLALEDKNIKELLSA